MDFNKIKVTEKAVELVWTKKHGATITTESLSSAEKPAPSLINALQNFKSYVVDLLGLPEAWFADLRVTTLSLDREDETGLRGLIVTAVHKVEKADGRVLVINTPRMRQASDEGNQKAKTLDDNTLEFIERAEKAAHGFVKGERTQVDMFPEGEKPPADETAEETAPATAGEKPRRRARGRVLPFVPEVGGVVNPDATLPPPGEAELHQLLADKGCDVPPEAIAKWTAMEYRQAVEWARATGLEEPPAFVAKVATASLWDEGAPHVTDDGVQEVKAATEAGD